MTVGDFQLPLAVLWVRDVQPLEGACVGGREGGSHGASQGDGEGWEATRSPGMSSLAVLGENLSCRTGSLGAQRVPALLSCLLVPGDNSTVALSAEGLLSQREQNPASFCLPGFLRAL